MTSTQDSFCQVPIISPARPAVITITESALARLEQAVALQNEETKIHVTSNQSTIVGILNQKNREKSSTKVALILHGVLSHKNQTYHRELASQLPIDSFRFDFRGNHESSGEWKVDGISSDVQDISDMVNYLEQEHQYQVDLVVAHSRGALAAWNFFSTSEEFHRGRLQSRIPHFVSLSARWDLAAAEDRNDVQQQAFKEKGHFTWKLKVGGELKEYRVTKAGVERFSRFPIKQIVRALPADVHVLVIHGTHDRTVPTKDAFAYIEALRASPARQTDKIDIHLVDGADHLYKGQQDQVVSIICQWYTRKSTAAPTSAALSRL